MKITKLGVLLSAALSFSLSGCATNNVVKSAESRIHVGYPGDNKKEGDGYYIKITSISGVWEVSDISRRPLSRDADDEEILYISRDKNYVSPSFHIIHNMDKNGENSFTCFMIGVGEVNEKYNACNSKTTSIASRNVGGQAAFALMTFGLGAVTAHSTRQVDPEKVLGMINQSDAFNKIEKFEYIDLYKTAKTSSDYNRFISAYQHNDPDGLIPLAISLRDAALINEDAAASLAAEKKKLDDQRIQHAQREQQKSRDAKITIARAEIHDFRASMRSGMKSHCGLVVEVKSPVVQVQTHVGVYWFSMDELYPRGMAECKFVNGVYMRPRDLPY